MTMNLNTSGNVVLLCSVLFIFSKVQNDQLNIATFILHVVHTWE